MSDYYPPVDDDSSWGEDHPSLDCREDDDPYSDRLCRVRYERFVTQTDKAALYVFLGEEKWVPLSQTRDDDAGVLTVPRWLAHKNGLHEEPERPAPPGGWT